MDKRKEENIVKVQRENHFDELMTTLKYFAHAGIVTDLVLVTEGEPLHMHHVILSCFSNYIQYLSENKNVKHFVHLAQRKTILEALIDYIYKGIVSIPRVHKGQLIMAGTSLHITDFTSINIIDSDQCSKDVDEATIKCPDHKLQLCRKIWHARQNQSESDVIFIVNNKYKCFAHACILGACSSFLLQIFTEHCMEKRKPYVVALRNIEKAHLELVLEFCYRGDICVPLKDIQSVYKIADLLGIEILCKLLTSKQSANITVREPVQEKEQCSANIMRNSVQPTALADLLKHERLVDVFIIAKERTFKAHSVILSVYSVFFKELANFLNYNLKGIIILTENIDIQCIESLLEYIYIGEVEFEGSAEEFCASMSDWLDLNILPLSPEVAPQRFTPIQSSCEEYECKIKTANIDETVLRLKNERSKHMETAKNRENEESKKTTKKESFENEILKEQCILIKKEIKNCDYDTVSSKEITHIYQNEDRTKLYMEHQNSEDCIESESEYLREVMENSCDRMNEINISRTFSGIFVHLEADMKNEVTELECVNGNVEMEYNTTDKLANLKSEKNNLEDCSDIKENMKINTYTSQIMKKNIKMGSQVQFDNVVRQRLEKEGSETDEPEILESVNACQLISESDDSTKNNIMTIAKETKHRVFQCQTCNEKFKARWEFKLHLSEHPHGNIYQCKYCPKEFNRPSDLQAHLRSHTGARPLQCGVCGMSFMSKNTLRKHEHIHSRNKMNDFECEVCNKSFSRKQYLQEHKRTHTGNKPFECDVCHKSFVGKTGLNHHKKTHKSADEKKCAVCEICGKGFTRHALWSHMKHHNKEHKCEFCSKLFATTADLKTHISGAHLGQSCHHCSTCGKDFVRKGHLNRHLKTHDDRKIIMSTCDLCPSKFKDEARLKAHVKRKHTEQNNRPQTCSICSKHFSTQSTLIYHQRLHFHERPHRCNLCGKTFAMPYQLRDHSRLHHSDEKPFPCTVCKKKCATQALLNRHLLTHRPTFSPKIKPPGSFTCNVCDKIFPTKLALSNHSRAHNFSRPYQCNICRKAFRYQDSLLKHLRLHPNEPSHETVATKELPCIYTIQVCRPSFAPISSDVRKDYASEQTHSEVFNSEPVPEVCNDSMCLNISEKTTDDISLLQLKPVGETYLSQTILQHEEGEYASIQSIEASSMCNMPVDKPDMSSLLRRPYSITIDGNLCCNSAVSTDGDITPSITLLPERTELEISDVDVSVPSHVLLPVTHSTTMVELTQLTVPLPPEQATQEFNNTLTKGFSL